MKPLSRRQAEVLELLVGGTRQQQAAEVLGIATSSIAVHFERARIKLGAKTRDQAIAIFAREKVKEEI